MAERDIYMYFDMEASIRRLIPDLLKHSRRVTRLKGRIERSARLETELVVIVEKLNFLLDIAKEMLDFNIAVSGLELTSLLETGEITPEGLSEIRSSKTFRRLISYID